jgi:hypothetical protein
MSTVKIWFVENDPAELPLVTNLVRSLGDFNYGLISVKTARQVEAEEGFAELLLSCLKASNVEIITEHPVGFNALRLEEVAFTVTNNASPALDELHEAIGEAVQVGESELPPVISAPRCEICGEAFEPKTKNSKVCDKKECRMEKQRRYARDYAKKHPLKKPTAVVEEESPALPEHKEGEPNGLWPYKVIDGADAGRLITLETLELWLKIARLPAGTMLEHYQKGRYMVAKKDGGKKGMTLRKVVAAEAKHE